MRRFVLAMLVVLFSSLALSAQQLTVYAIDTEGGKATLIVTAEHESLLVDTGWPYDSRDAYRIAAAAKDAGINKIDYLLVTHYHIDHVGGLPWLLQRLPVAHVIDHGPTTEQNGDAQELYVAYQRASANIPHIVVKPGDKIPLKGVDIQVVSSAGALLKAAGGESQNELCKGVEAKALENGENDQSVGFVLTYGKFRMVDLADVTRGKEYGLVCPANLVGKTDVFMVSHHGLDRSNSPLLIRSLQPRVAIMNNGAVKGGSPQVVKDLYASPGFEGLWMLHAIHGSGEAGNARDKFVANPDEKCLGYPIKLSATADGAFAITNQRTRETVSYQAK